MLAARFRGADSCLLADANGNLDPEAPPADKYGRRRSRAVLYQLSGHYKQDKIKTKLKLNNVSTLYLYFLTYGHKSLEENTATKLGQMYEAESNENFKIVFKQHGRIFDLQLPKLYQ